MPLSSRDLCSRRGQERAERSKPVSLWPGWRRNEEVVDACYTRAPSVKAMMPGREETALEFGELQDVTLRDVWGNEAQHFTPWLAANMERLSEAIGIPLESEGTEVAVEQFSADIVARNPADGSRVLIENQLEGSDHRHLGQILTYLAGVQAQTVIWVARDFDESHRSAIRWLNDHTEEPFAFFAVRVRVVQIADSPLVPLFEVLERPSAWDRTVRGRLEVQRRAPPLAPSVVPAGVERYRADDWPTERRGRSRPRRPRPRVMRGQRESRSGSATGSPSTVVRRTRWTRCWRVAPRRS